MSATPFVSVSLHFPTIDMPSAWPDVSALSRAARARSNVRDVPLMSDTFVICS